MAVHMITDRMDKGIQKAGMVSFDANPGVATSAVARAADAMVVGNSRSWSSCAAMGTPVVRLSQYSTGDWISAYSDPGELLSDLDIGEARKPDAAMAKRWFAFHFANCVFGIRNG